LPERWVPHDAVGAFHGTPLRKTEQTQHMTHKKSKNIYIVSIEKGEEIIETLKELSVAESIKTASISGIGAAEKIILGYFDTITKEYTETTLEGSHEITNLTGNITRKDGDPYIHCHITVAGKDFASHGGHLSSAIVSGACEIVVQIVDEEIEREFNEDVGLNMMRL